MPASLSRGNLLFVTIIMGAVILLLLIPGVASGQDNNEEEPVPEIEPIPDPEIEIEITEEGNGFFQDMGTFFWILAGLLLIIILLLVFLVGRSGRSREK